MTADIFDIRAMSDDSSTIDQHTNASPWPAQVWLVWALAAIALIQLAPNPVYVSLVIAISWLMVEMYRKDSPMGVAFPVIVSIGLALALFRVVIAAATSHGTGSVMFTTPSLTLPRILGGFTIGGPVDAVIVANAAAEAFAILGIIVAFGAFNTVISHYELIQAAPRAFYELGVVLVLALAIVPSTISAISQSAEATRARTGGKPHRRRRLLHTALPVLESGMERATGLAESMDSRGFARAPVSRTETASMWLGIVSMLLGASGLVALVAQSMTSAGILFGLSGTVMICAIATASSGTRRQRYRPRKVDRISMLVIALLITAPLGLAVCATAGLPGTTTLRWPAEELTWPELAPLPTLFTLILLTPLIRRRALFT